MRSEDLKRLGVQALVYGVLVYVLYECIDGVRKAKPKSVAVALVLMLIAFSIGAFWMYKHLTCEGCQERFKNAKRRIALRFVE